MPFFALFCPFLIIYSESCVRLQPSQQNDGAGSGGISGRLDLVDIDTLLHHSPDDSGFLPLSF